MDMELKILFVVALGFITFSIIISVLVHRIDELRLRLNEIKDMYRIMDASYEIVLARTNELGDKIQELEKITSICYKHINDSCSFLETIISDIHNCQDTIDDVYMCVNSINDVVMPVIRSDHDILEELKDKILTEIEKETDNDN